jgi:membrane protein YdbS with pleckstrin-like domain
VSLYTTYKAPHGNKRLWEGVGIAFAIMGVCFLLAFACFSTWSTWGPNGPESPWTSIPLLLLSFYGATQWIVVLPAYFFYRKKNFKFTAQGLLWGAGGIMLANAVLYFVL